MSNPLQQRLQNIRRRVRHVVWLYGISWVVVTLFSTLLTVGLSDWLLHFDDAGLRLLFSLSIFAGTAWVSWRYLITPLRIRFSDVAVARRIEQRYPMFKDSLSSTVQFLESDQNDSLGSPELQQQVINQTLQNLQRVDVADVLQSRGILRIGAAAVLVSLATAAIVGFNQTEAAVALRRIALPLAETPWPKTTVLRLLNAQWEPIVRDEDDPVRIARGDTLELYVENTNGQLPSDLSVEYRIAEGEPVSEPIRTISVRRPGHELNELGTISLAVTQGPIAIRAVGGDDRNTTWLTVKVVPPPLLEDMSVTVTPPEYAGLLAETLPPGVGHIEALVGSQVSVTGHANKALNVARLRLKNSESQDITIAENGRDLQATFTISDSGTSSYWFELVDNQGFENAEAPRYEIRGIADHIPDIYIEKPGTDVRLTPQAVLPLTVSAKDDLQLTDVRIRYRSSDSESDPLTTIPLVDSQQLGNQVSVDYNWSIASLQLQPGNRVVFHAEATDAYDLGSPHIGRSVPRTIVIVSADEKREELASRQAEILEKLENAHEIQDRANRQVEELRTQLGKTGKLRPEDVDLLKRVELDQGRVAATLVTAGNSLSAQVDQVREEMKNNQLEDEEVETRLGQLADELEYLRRESLPTAERALTRARKSAQAGATSPNSKSSTRPADPTAPKYHPPEEKPNSDPNPKNGSTSKNSAKADKSSRTATPENDTETGKRKPPEGKSKEDSDAVANQSMGESLAETESSQDAILDSLSSMRDLVARWERRREVTHDLDELTSRQAELNEKTAKLGRELLARPTASLQPQEEADLAKLSGEQGHLAEQMDQFRRKLSVAVERAGQQGTPEFDSLKDAQDQLRNDATAGKMRDTADRLGSKSTLGQAIRNQESVLEELQSLSETLTGSTTDDSETLVKKLEQAEDDLNLIKEQQHELLRKTEDANQLARSSERDELLESLRKEQEQLNEKALELARRLRRLKAHQAQESLQRSTQAMKRAQSGLEGNDPEDSPTKEMQEVLDDLEQAQRELAQTRRAAEELLEQEQLEKIADELKGLVARQKQVIEETTRLGEELEKTARWTRPRLATLRRLADVETALKEQTALLAEDIKSAEIYSLALRGASRLLQMAVERLNEKDVGANALRLEKSALGRLEQLVAALNSEKDKPRGAQPPQQQEQEQPQQNQPVGDGIPSLAELRMLITLQEGLNERTAQIDQLRDDDGNLSEPLQRELEEIAGEQGELADLARNLMQYFGPPNVRDDEGDQPDASEKPEDGSESQPKKPSDDDAKPLLKRPTGE